MEATCLRILEEEVRTSGASDASTLLRRVVRAGHEPARDKLVEAMLIGTTWFLREPATLARMVGHLKAQNLTEASIWCAGVSTGQEAYSAAITLLEAGIEPRVVGTDINKSALTVAKTGRYSACNGSGLPKEWLGRWYSQEPGGHVCIDPSVRKRVTFIRHNLIRDTAPPYPYQGFHIVLCRNVLMYFETSDSRAVAQKLRDALLPGGTLLLGAVEVPLLDNTGTSVALPNAYSRVVTVPAAEPKASSPALLPSITEVEQLIERDELELAIALVQQRIHAAPLDPILHTAMGVIHRLRGDNEQASEAFRAASFLDPKAWYPAYQLGCTLESLASIPSAKRAFGHALATLDSDGRSGSPFATSELDILKNTVRDTCKRKLKLLAS